MISDALAGKIDLIVTKSVSRFARNTVDSLTTVRKLKEKGVEVYFEKENIYTLDSKGELLITIMSSIIIRKYAKINSFSISATPPFYMDYITKKRPCIAYLRKVAYLLEDAGIYPFCLF